jgi:hypothetical protein
MNRASSAESSTAGHEAAVLGVVIAGVLTSFVIPGPFDRGSLLIGLLLIAVLVGYGRFPPRGRDNRRRALAAAAAVGMCLLLVTGSLLDQFHVERDGRQVHLLTDWPAEALPTDGSDPTATDERTPTREESDRPNSHDGTWLLLLWLVLSGGAYLWWSLRAKPSTDASTHKRPAQS